MKEFNLLNRYRVIKMICFILGVMCYIDVFGGIGLSHVNYQIYVCRVFVLFTFYSFDFWSICSDNSCFFMILELCLFLIFSLSILLVLPVLLIFEMNQLFVSLIFSLYYFPVLNYIDFCISFYYFPPYSWFGFTLIFFSRFLW